MTITNSNDKNQLMTNNDIGDTCNKPSNLGAPDFQTNPDND